MRRTAVPCDYLSERMSHTWAIVRIGLGLAQVMGATITLYLLLTAGLSDLTLWATVATLFFVVLSKVVVAKQD